MVFLIVVPEYVDKTYIWQQLNSKNYVISIH